jgi:riboflavin kinase/FMN adenylyltransferase
MLKTVELTKKLHKKDGAAMLLGGFDGLHVGHCKLLSRAKESGLPVGIMSIVGGKEEKNLFTFREREEIFKREGVDFVFELPFAEIKDYTPEEFLELLLKEFQPQLFICGEDFRFGAKAKGTPQTLKQATHVHVDVQSLVKIDGDKISSTYIKNLLKNGEVEKANSFLSEPFFLIGEVFSDRQVGRTIGFPTANVAYPMEKYPLKLGVYETRVEIDGITYKGITNYGARPTFDNQTVLTETHLDGFEGDLYGREMKIRFIRFLRDVQKFNGVNALKEQLTKDIRRIREDD